MTLQIATFKEELHHCITNYKFYYPSYYFAVYPKSESICLSEKYVILAGRRPDTSKDVGKANAQQLIFWNTTGTWGDY
jgi:hypothetical protein